MADTVTEQIRKKAEALQRLKPHLTHEQAIVQVLEQAPRLFTAWRRESRARLMNEIFNPKAGGR